MKIVIAPQAFKGTLSAGRAADAMGEAALAVYPHADVVRCPVADGGDGTLDALIEATGGAYHNVETTGPLGEAGRGAMGFPWRWPYRRGRDGAGVRSRAAAIQRPRPAQLDDLRRWRHHPSSA